MQLVYYPDPRLRKVCIEDIIRPQKERARIAAKMWNIMRKRRGVGLAASQVGLDVRMFIFLRNEESHVVWNPNLSCVSGNEESIEGCLSLPGIKVTVKRATSSILTGQGIDGIPVQYSGDAIDTRIWQHEIDHLNGKLIIDDMSLEETLSNKEALSMLTKACETV